MADVVYAPRATWRVAPREADRTLVSNSRMIVTRTPLRVSFAGGGTDLPAFFEREMGAVLSTAIDRYVYVTVKRHSELFFEPIRINYSKSEQVDAIDQIENRIARECLRLLEIEPPIYISTVGDVPASTGLGGSSAFAVGLLNALHAYRGERISAGQLAEEASHVEIGVLGEPIGKQDQYAAAFGGMNLFCFRRGGGVTVEHQRITNGDLRLLFDSILLFWTGHQRDASVVLSEQKHNTPMRVEYLRRMRDQALELHELLDRRPFDPRGVGRILDSGWRLKRELASGITTTQIDRWYEAAMEAGAEGGKLCGAGGGGFLMFIVPPVHQPAVCAALSELTLMRVGPESHGSHIIMPLNGG
jgi:D-glycero-alpha-D-manno-heptose-7-phosphate kinase